MGASGEERGNRSESSVGDAASVVGRGVCGAGVEVVAMVVWIGSMGHEMVVVVGVVGFGEVVGVHGEGMEWGGD